MNAEELLDLALSGQPLNLVTLKPLLKELVGGQSAGSLMGLLTPDMLERVQPVIDALQGGGSLNARALAPVGFQLLKAKRAAEGPPVRLTHLACGEGMMRLQETLPLEEGVLLAGLKALLGETEPLAPKSLFDSPPANRPQGQPLSAEEQMFVTASQQYTLRRQCCVDFSDLLARALEPEATSGEGLWRVSRSIRQKPAEVEQALQGLIFQEGVLSPPAERRILMSFFDLLCLAVRDEVRTRGQKPAAEQK